MSKAKTDEFIDTEYMQEYMAKAKVALSVTNALAYLEKNNLLARDLTAEECQNICDIVYFCMNQISRQQLAEYINAAERDLDTEAGSTVLGNA